MRRCRKSEAAQSATMDVAHLMTGSVLVAGNVRPPTIQACAPQPTSFRLGVIGGRLWLASLGALDRCAGQRGLSDDQKQEKAYKGGGGARLQEVPARQAAASSSGDRQIRKDLRTCVVQNAAQSGRNSRWTSIAAACRRMLAALFTYKLANSRAEHFAIILSIDEN